MTLIVGSGVGTYFWLNELGVFKFSESDLKAITNYQHQDNSIVFDSKGKKIGEFFSSYYIFI